MNRKFVVAVALVLVTRAYPPSVTLAQDANQPAPKSSSDVELIQLRLEKRLSEQEQKIRQDMDAKLASEIKEHRLYLQQLDDKFYDRLKFWFPVFSGIFALIVAFFLWHFGKTRQEAYEAAKNEAVTKASEMATKKVEQIVIPDRVLKEAEETNAATIASIRELKNQLTQEVQRELETTRNEVVANKYDLINQALDEALRSKFSKELDVLGRLDGFDSKLHELSKRLESLEDLLKLDAIRRAVSRSEDSISIEMPLTLRTIQKMAELAAKTVLSMRPPH